MPSLDEIQKQIEKGLKKSEHGGFSLNAAPASNERIPTGIFAFDLATLGGFTRGSVNIVYGKTDASKTTLVLCAMREAQKLYPDHKVVFVDMEGHFREEWAEKLGVDLSPERWRLWRFASAEQVIDSIEATLFADDLALIGVDSLASFTSKTELNAPAEKALPGVSGLAINKFYRKTCVALGEARQHGLYPTVILLNQIRYKVGVMFGSPETTPGGDSPHYQAALSIRMTAKKGKDEKISRFKAPYREVKATIEKNKVPIFADSMEWLMAAKDVPSLNLKAGKTHDAATMLSYLGYLELLEYKGKKWALQLGDETVEFPNKDAVKHALMFDEKLAPAVREMLLDKGRELA